MKSSPLRKMFATTFVVGGRMLIPPRAHGRSRIRMMMRHTWLVSVAVVLLCAGIAGAALYVASRPTTVTIAVGPSNGEDAKLVAAMTKQFERERSTVRLRQVDKSGTIESAKALDGKEVEFAVVRRDIAMPQSGLAVAVLRKNVAVLMVPAPGSAALGPAKARAAKGAKPKKIEKIGDISGHRIGVVSRVNPTTDGGSSANVNVLNAILKQYQVAPDKVTIVTLDPDNVAESLREKPVDVIFAAGPVTARFISDAIAAASTAKSEPTFLSVDAAEAIENRYPVYEATEIKAGVFGGHKPLPEEEIKTISFSHYILARRSVSDSVVGDFTKYLFNARQSLTAEFPGAAKIEKPDTDRDAAVSAHPGAAAYLDNDQKTFFDRYSDLLYWGLMVMSFFGSGIAWLTSYGKADERLQRMHVLDHLLDVMKEARAATTLDELTKLRADADDILRKTISQVEKNDLDESALMAFSLALDQAQIAIADRRAQLAGHPPAEGEAQGEVHSEAEVTQLRVATP
jgi:TRAP transporter TAXI family solute receptor